MTSPTDTAACLPHLALGTEVGRSAAVVISQQTISAFAEVTEDRQWIHVDEGRAIMGCFGQTTAHGYLLLSMIPRITRSLLDLESQGTVVNYGLNKVRFPGAARSGHEFTDGITLQGRTRKETGMLYEFQHELTDITTGEVVCVANTLTLIQGDDVAPL